MDGIRLNGRRLRQGMHRTRGTMSGSWLRARGLNWFVVDSDSWRKGCKFGNIGSLPPVVMKDVPGRVKLEYC